MIIITDKDATWRTPAILMRDALEILGRPVPRCLPDEAESCGGGFSDHFVSYAMFVTAWINHQMTHANPPPKMLAEITLAAVKEVTENCQEH